MGFRLTNGNYMIAPITRDTSMISSSRRCRAPFKIWTGSLVRWVKAPLKLFKRIIAEYSRGPLNRGTSECIRRALQKCRLEGG